mgnify:CR=1 FL=1
MSQPIEIYDNDDLPCVDWLDSSNEIENCPMFDKWHEGETRCCGQCGWLITYNSNQEEINIKI